MMTYKYYKNETKIKDKSKRKISNENTCIEDYEETFAKLQRVFTMILNLDLFKYTFTDNYRY